MTNDQMPPSMKLKEILHANQELLLAVVSGLTWGIGGIIFLYNSGTTNLSTVLFIIAILTGGYNTLIDSISALMKRKLSIDSLMFLAAVGAIYLGKLGDAALLLFLFSLGHALEHFALNRVKKSFSALNKLSSPSALVKRDGALIEEAIENLKIGDIIVVKPNTRIPVDGLVILGESDVDQSAITGESMPISKTARQVDGALKDFNYYDSKQKVFAGTVNGQGALEILTMRLSKDSTLNKLITLVKEAESQKSNTQHLADNFEKYYVPAVLLLVSTLMFAFLIIDEPFENSFYRAMATLIAASPCALAISTPSAILAGIARAAKQGVLIKGGRALEDLAEIDVIAFDKTGTLTEGKPKLVQIIPYHDYTKESLLKLAVAVESLSDHPIAQAIVNGAKDLSNIPTAENVVSLTARGVKASINKEIIHIGNKRLMEEITTNKIPKLVEDDLFELESNGQTVLIIHYKNNIIGIIGVMDTERAEAADTIIKLKDLGIKKLIMLSGDNQGVANAIAKKIGLVNPLGNLLPEDKVSIIEGLSKQKYNVAMVGDGVNDAPALAKASLGIAMGAAGSDVALDTADVALMSDKLDKLPFAIKLSKKAKRIIKQNLVISLGMVAILVPLTILGIAEIGPAVIGHEGSTIVVVLNALRLLNFNE